MGASEQELSSLAVSLGQQSYRGGQLFSWIHRRGVFETAGMTNLPESFRGKLEAIGPVLPLGPGEILRSEDGTRKIQVVLRDGYKVETVLIPEGDKLTQCVSSQVGCAVGCVFCRSGTEGLKRNLKAAEIVGQLHLARPYYREGERLANVVLMGVGEPLHNVRQVLRSLEIMSSAAGLDLSTRRVTLSTVGVPKGIEQLARATEGKTAMAISLHAGNEDVRRRLVPGVSASLGEIVATLEKYPLPKRRRFTIEYVLVGGINDRDSDARSLVRLLSKLKVKVNLLPLNPHDRTGLQPPDDARVERFKEILASKGISVFLRRRRGADIGAACGQLLATE